MQSKIIAEGRGEREQWQATQTSKDVNSIDEFGLRYIEMTKSRNLMPKSEVFMKSHIIHSTLAWLTLAGLSLVACKQAGFQYFVQEVSQ